MINQITRAVHAGTLTFAILMAGSAFSQTLVTDADDYLPGETVYFAGAGFAANESVGLTLKVVSSTDEVIDYAIGGISADSSGDFTATWLVPAEALNTAITGTAVGLSSRRVAKVLFYDGYYANVYNVSLISSGDYVTLSFDVQYRDDYYNRPNPYGYAVYELYQNGVSQGNRTIYQTSYNSYTNRSYSATFLGPCDTEYTLRRVYAYYQRRVNSWWWGGSYFNTYIESTYYNFSPAASTSPCLPCLVNCPPSIELSSLDLGNITGCISNGQFIASSTVTSQDFSPLGTDPDGDPVSVVFNGPLTFDWVGAGEAQATVSFTATDDPSWRQGTSSCTLNPEQTTVEATVTARVVYDVEGPLSPLSANQMTLKKLRRTIPIKFRLRDCNGVEVTPASLPSMADITEVPTIDSIVTSSMSPDGDAPAEDPGQSFNNDLLFVYDGSQWHYNLSTKGPGWTKGLMYTAQILLNDGTTQEVAFGLK